MREIWKDLTRAPRLYQISNFGNFKAKPKIDGNGKHRKERMLIPTTTKDGYKRFNLFIGGKSYRALAHRLVYETFCGPIPQGLEINHKNGIRDDNRAENLEAITHSQNVRYSRDVLGADYATYANGRMTKEQREEIFLLRSQGLTHRAIGKRIGFCKTQISNVLSHKCWDIS